MEKELLKTSESELSGSDLERKTANVFASSEINSVRYWREVRRILVKNMDTDRPLSTLHWASHQRRYEKWGKSIKRPCPMYDAWMCVRGRQETLLTCHCF